MATENRYLLRKRKDYGWDACVVGEPEKTAEGDTQGHAIMALLVYLDLLEVETTPPRRTDTSTEGTHG